MKHTVYISLIITELCLLFYSALCTVYNYNWDPELKKINYDSVIVLKLIYIILIIASIYGFYISWRKSLWLKMIQIVVFLFSAYRIMFIFYITY